MSARSVRPQSTHSATRFAMRFVLAAAAVGGAAVVTAARPLPRTPAPVLRATGVTFKYRVISASQDKRQRDSRAVFADVRMQDGNVRMDYLEGVTPVGTKNGYVLVQGDAGKFIIVNPKDKQAMVMNADGFGSGLGALMNNPMLKLTVSDVSFRFKDMGPGETMLGYKTRKVRTWYSSTMELKAMMMPDQKIVSNDSTDQWIATGLDFGQKNLETWARSFASGAKSSNPALAAELQKYTNEYGRTGMALKTVTYVHQTDKKGKVTTDTVTMEVTDLKTGTIAASVFEVPKDYEVVDLSQMMAAAADKVDSANKADGDKKGDEKKPSAKDAIKAGLGGMFKKKPPV